MTRTSLWLGLACGALAGCGGDVNLNERACKANLVPDAAWVDFGSVSVGGTATATLVLREAGDCQITVTKADISPDGPVTLTASVDGTLIEESGAADGADYLGIPLAFSPTSADPFAGSLRVDVDNDDLVSVQIPVYGLGVPVAVQFLPSILDFGQITTSETQSATLRNVGAASVTIADTVLPGEGFTATALTAGELAAGASVTVEVTATATTAAEDTLSVVLAEGDTIDLDLVANQCDEQTLPVDADGDGYTLCGGDCDDSDDAVHPGVVETPDTVDNDCNGTVDDRTIWYDDDGDGFVEDSDGDGLYEAGDDCDDSDPDTNPMSDVTEAGVDRNCDGTLPGDTDGDGFTEDGGDCAPTDAGVHPGALETPDGVDQDCDGDIDEGTTAIDDDGDGYSEDDGDCDDNASTESPAGVETGNGIDDNCDGQVDEGTDRADDDGDGFTELGGDCDDTDAATSPGALDLASDGEDTNCDGQD